MIDYLMINDNTDGSYGDYDNCCVYDGILDIIPDIDMGVSIVMGVPQ